LIFHHPEEMQAFSEALSERSLFFSFPFPLLFVFGSVESEISESSFTDAASSTSTGSPTI
jgi:hypothetical protein